MRIIAGEAKGRKLKSIKNTSTRPTLDRVKESLFNIITPYLMLDKGLDLFAGFGSLGIEALSRGVGSFYFIEKNIKNCRVIKENIKIAGFENRAYVKQDNVFNFLKNTVEKYDLILMDPPYKKSFIEDSLSLIIEKNILNEHGIIVAEHEKDLELSKISDLIVISHKIYGDTALSILTIGGE